MSRRTNKEVVEGFFLDIYNHRKYEMAHEYFTPDYRDNGPDGAKSPQDAVEVFLKTHEAFPDIEVTIDDLIEEDDRVAFRGRFRGTHLGEFAGLTPSEAKVDFEALEMFRLENGRIAESWGYWPNSLILEQLNRL